MIRSFPPHPNPLPPGERVGHSPPQQNWGVFWHILINGQKTSLTGCYRNISPWNKKVGVTQSKKKKDGEIESCWISSNRQAIVITYLPTQLSALESPTIAVKGS